LATAAAEAAAAICLFFKVSASDGRLCCGILFVRVREGGGGSDN
jgi:hypothetical protein